MNDPYQLLTSAAVGRIVDRTPDTIRRLAREGRLPYKTAYGGIRLYRLSDVLKLRETLRRKAESLASLNELDVETDDSQTPTPLLNRPSHLESDEPSAGRDASNAPLSDVEPPLWSLPQEERLRRLNELQRGGSR